MSQCVPSWDVEDSPTVPPKLTLRAQSYFNSLIPDVPMLDYEVAELTWKNGQIAINGLGPPRVPTTWEKPRAGGTLESLVNQATRLPHPKSAVDGGGAEELVPWFDHHHNRAGDGRAFSSASVATASAPMTMDALVPCSNRSQEPSAQHVLNSASMMSGIGTCMVGCSTRVGSCSGAATCEDRRDGGEEAQKRVAVAAHEWSSRDSGSATFGRNSRHVTLDTRENSGLNVGGFTSTSMGSSENTSSGKQSTKATTADDHDSVCHSRPPRATGKASVSTKRSRAAAIHNQSERKRRDKINQRMKTLQKMVPNSNKTDKASMLDEVIEYLKQLQAQVQLMSRVNMSPMMLPMTLQQQLQMAMMAPMGMGMGMGGMDMNSIGRPNVAGITPAVLHPTAFMPLTSWDGTGTVDRLSGPAASLIPDPLSTFLACQSQSQSQPTTMDAYRRMAALYQHMQQQPSASGSKN